MKWLSFLKSWGAFLLICIFQQAGAQSVDSANSVASNRQLRKAIITKMDKKMAEGWLLKATDDSLYLLPTSMKDLSRDNFLEPERLARQWTIAPESIRQLKVQRKNAVLRGTLIGFAAGILTGAIIGLAEGDDPVMSYSDDPFLNITASVNNAFAMTATEKATIYGASIGLIGAGAGALLGNIKWKIDIGGNKETYKANLETIRLKSLAQ